MPRKRITQRFPWLLPLRTRQRKFCFYQGMRLDQNHYAKTRREDPLPVELYTSSCPMVNPDTGFDLIYQENKVHNLKLAAAPINGLLIRPGETFSFWMSARHADREIPYREGLTEIDGKLTTTKGGGLCMITNLLFWVFLHSPLTIVERHGHPRKDFPEPPSDAPLGVDATVAEGWLDLKVRNDTGRTFQIGISFDETHITGTLRMERDEGICYRVYNGPVTYAKENGEIIESVDIIRERISRETGQVLTQKIMYCNQCEIGYPLPEGTPVIEKGSDI